MECYNGFYSIRNKYQYLFLKIHRMDDFDTTGVTIKTVESFNIPD